MVIAHKSTSEEIGILRKVFQSYDVHKDGTIQLPQFRLALASYGYPEDQILRIFEGVDLDGSGKIRYTEFLAATIEVHGAIDEERLAEAFDRLDCDDSGYISAGTQFCWTGRSMKSCCSCALLTLPFVQRIFENF